MPTPHGNNGPKNNHNAKPLIGEATQGKTPKAPRRSVQSPQKRFMILVQHEVIMYGENEKVAVSNLLRSDFMKDRTNPKCVFVQEIPMPNDEPAQEIIDVRKAPGS